MAVRGSLEGPQVGLTRVRASLPPRSAQIRRPDSPPSAPMSKATRWCRYESATISVELSGVTAIPFGNARSSATSRTGPSAGTRTTEPGLNSSPAVGLNPAPLT